MPNLVSIIIPVYNGSSWIDTCFNSILSQTAIGTVELEICVCNDASTDDSIDLLKLWKEKLFNKGIKFKLHTNDLGSPLGVGYAKNRAVEISSGAYLCFQDIDDIMLPDRILKQYLAATTYRDALIGSKFKRSPEMSTIRFTKWANDIPQNKLNIQVFTSHGPTIVMPTWFCHRDVFERVGGFCEEGKGVPEDLIFFYKHLDISGKVERVEETLLIYTYHLDSTTFSVDEHTIWALRLARLENVILSTWSSFTIWNAGKQGRKLFNSLSEDNRKKVVAFCDVDENKIGKQYIPFDTSSRKSSFPVDIIHFQSAKPPFIICVKMDLTGGVFEENLGSLQLKEGVDFVLFS